MAKGKFLGREALTKKLQKLVPEAEKEYAAAIEKSAKELANAIRAAAPEVSGEYKSSIEAIKVSGRNKLAAVGITQTKDPHAWGVYASYIWRFIEFGTKAHIIRPRKLDFLSFFRGGKLVTAKQVKHPGSNPRPHIFPTYRAMRKRIRSRVARAVNKAVRKVAAGGGA
jgi:HK97 gp10 family phage protein